MNQRARYRHIGWKFWLQWILASTVGLATGLGLAGLYGVSGFAGRAVVDVVYGSEGDGKDNGDNVALACVVNAAVA